MARKTIGDRRADTIARMDALKRELAELDAKAGERIGKLAVRAGLADLDLDDDALMREFQALAGRFQSKRKEPGGSSSAADDPA